MRTIRDGESSPHFALRCGMAPRYRIERPDPQRLPRKNGGTRDGWVVHKAPAEVCRPRSFAGRGARVNQRGAVPALVQEAWKPRYWSGAQLERFVAPIWDRG